MHACRVNKLSVFPYLVILEDMNGFCCKALSATEFLGTHLSPFIGQITNSKC